MVRVRNPLTQEIMSVRGATTFWVTDGTGSKHKYLIEDYKVDKGAKPAPEAKATPEVKAEAEKSEVKVAPEANPNGVLPGAQQVVVKQPIVKQEGVQSGGGNPKPEAKPAGSVLDEWWF